MMSENPYLGLPLEGLRLIEASAGTGKTFTLATLFTRLVVERGLSLAQILAVTYTEAATQELRARIRERLALAVEVLSSPPADDAATEVVLTRKIVERQLAQGLETRAALTRRLRRAVEDADLASIFTIHGFCARVLREYALESGQPLIQHSLVSNLFTANLRATFGAATAAAQKTPHFWPGYGKTPPPSPATSRDCPVTLRSARRFPRSCCPTRM